MSTPPSSPSPARDVALLVSIVGGALGALGALLAAMGVVLSLVFHLLLRPTAVELDLAANEVTGFLLVITAGAAGLAITGVALARRRPWARKAMIGFMALGVVANVVGTAGAAAFALLTPVPDATPQELVWVRAGALLSVLLLGLGLAVVLGAIGWWLGRPQVVEEVGG